MEKKDFKISYQSIKNFVTAGFFLIVLWAIISRYYDFIANAQFKNLLGGTNSAVEITIFILIGYGLIRLFYVICGGLVGFFYKTFRNDEWYSSLTQYIIKIPMTKKQHNQIKNNKIFFSQSLEFKDSKPYYDSGKLRKWAEKIIEKELKRLK